MNRRDVLAGTVATAAILTAPGRAIARGNVRRAIVAERAIPESVAMGGGAGGAFLILADADPAAALHRLVDMWRHRRVDHVVGLTRPAIAALVERLAIDHRAGRFVRSAPSGRGLVAWTIEAPRPAAGA